MGKGQTIRRLAKYALNLFGVIGFKSWGRIREEKGLKSVNSCTDKQ